MDGEKRPGQNRRRQQHVAGHLLCAGVVVALILASAMPAAGRLPGAGGTPLGTGDTIRMSMEEDSKVAFEGEVSIAGTIPLPYLREVHVVGKTAQQAEAHIAERLTEKLYQTATVTVVLIRKKPGRVYVYGAVKKPGIVDLPLNGELTVLQLVSEVQGLTSWAAPDRSYIMRRGEPGQPAEKLPVDLKRVFGEAATEVFLPVQAGDVFFVPGISGSSQQVMTADTCEIIVVGEVNMPGIVLFAPGEQRTAMRAVFKAGGFTKFAKDTKVRLIRYGSDDERTEETIDINAVVEEGFLDRDVDLRPGDMLIVPQKLINF